MSNAADPGAPANPDCHAAIGEGFKRGSESEILGNGREDEALCCPLNNTGQLCLPGAQSDGLLRSRPMLNG
eukprot:3466650-Alexandrium_andersonii.AAC.1